jgi:CHAT domain-containing protein
MIVPDGQLHTIPFETLFDGKSLLGDVMDIIYLSSGRDLLWAPLKKPNTDVVVFANPDLNNMPGETNIDLSSASRTTYQKMRTIELRRSPRGIKFGEFPSLRGAEFEANDIAQYFPDAQLNFWIDASEQNLFHLSAPPGVLHFSAHGFFLPDSEPDLVTGTRTPLTIESEPPPLNPLLRSMILLAGAARRRERFDSIYDGLATALEISTLPLVGTQMVVLSACDSGLGIILPGQGVAGLRRAFFVAGAETVVASLWKVDDAVTRELMRSFYRRLRDGVGRARAMHLAAEEIRQTHPHPFYWASFLVIGQGGPLRGGLIPASPPPPLLQR